MRPMSSMGAPPAAQPQEEMSGGQKALSVMRSLAGVLGGAAYAAGVSGASQNPWAGPHALAQLREQGVRAEMRRMQMAAQEEKQRRQTAIINHLQTNFTDMSDPNQRQAAIQYLMNQGAYEFAQKASGIFEQQYGSPAKVEQAKEVEEHKSELRMSEAEFEASLEAKAASGAPPDFTDVSKMGVNYGNRGGKVFKALTWSVGRIRAGYEQYLNAKTSGEKAVAYQTMVVALNKLLDPQSVVRESEFERTGTYQSLENQLKSALERLKTGSVAPEVMAGISEMGESLYREGVQLQTPIYEEYERKAQRYFGEWGVEDVLSGWEDPRKFAEGPRDMSVPPPATQETETPLMLQPPGSTGNSGITIEEITG